MGGGRQEFLPTWEQDIEGHSGKRTDGIDLIKQWKHKHRKQNAAYVQRKAELFNVSVSHMRGETVWISLIF